MKKNTRNLFKVKLCLGVEAPLVIVSVSHRPTHGKSLKSDIKKKELKKLTCNKCDDEFSKFCYLEYHIKENHGDFKQHKCYQCKKKYVTSWRLKMHVRIYLHIHNYFRNNLSCPFEELGCKLSLDVPQKDTFVQKDDTNIDKECETDNSKSMLNTSSYGTVGEATSFVTSTLKSNNSCEDSSECVDCFVNHMLVRDSKTRELFF